MEKNTPIMNTKNIYRYKFSNTFTDELYEFSKIHKYDERKDFKEAWAEFVNMKANVIQEEIKRLEDLGYSGDILDKMFKSTRYYFRKKTASTNTLKERRCYQTVSKELLDSIDSHIQTNFSQLDFKPSIYFNTYCKENEDILKTEILFLSRNGYNDINDIKEKIKKTYKNRYYLLSKRL
jgi:hypothetical protein